MWKNILKILVVFVIGTIGGIFADQILWPYFIERPLFYKYRLEQRPINQYITKEIIIQENTALIETISKVEKSIVGIKSLSKTKELEGSGLIVTVDGLIITLSDLVPKGWKVFVFLDNEKIPAKVLQRKNNLALLKVEKTNLSPVSFADFEKIKLGQRVFFVGVIFENDISQKLVNEGIIKTFNEKILKTNIYDSTSLWGSSLFNIEGELVGLNQVDKYGRVSAISIKQIRDFLKF